jgi:putative hemolysin
MRRARRHMVFVVDEQGAVVGIVTLEDIFEAIVGDIRDEYDEPEPEVQGVGGGVLESDGGVAVRELNSRYALSLPESPEYVTVAGLLLARLGKVPRGGETVDVEPYRVTVTQMAGRRIARVRIQLVHTTESRLGPREAGAGRPGSRRSEAEARQCRR